MINFKSYIDAGDPEFLQAGDLYQIVCAPGDRGRWLGDYADPINAGDELVLLAEVRMDGPEESCATVLITFWANEPGFVLHSIVNAAEFCGTMEEFKQIICPFTVPDNVKAFRIECRAWSGVGTREFKNLKIVPDEITEPPEKTGKMKSINLEVGNIQWQITASRTSVTATRSRIN